MDNVENMLQPGDCGTTLGWAEVISLQGRYFPKSIFPIVNFPRVYFSTWQLPECANSQAAASKVCPIYSARSPTLFYPQRSVPIPVLPAALGLLRHPSRRALPSVISWEMAHLGSCHWGHCHLGSRSWKTPVGKYITPFREYQ